jgi:3D-(3,5/4)-trihydroxycyclohexane-1,2-dione acylhydrolase (decyclizing)
MATVRLTVAQATITFLAAQYAERDGERNRFVAGCFGIFGHGNVAGLGQALLQEELRDPKTLPYVLGRNEQAMVHSAVGYARMKDRLQTWAVTSSVGPGATNMVTGAALATINRIPVLLLPGDTFATRVSTPVLQELERPDAGDITANDAFRPVSRYFDRVWRPEQLWGALLGAMRVLTDPADTGAVTIAMPQDVQAEAFDWPETLFAERVWHIRRPLPSHAEVQRAAAIIASSERPLIVAGGGVIYGGATNALARFCERTGIPVGQTQAGKGALPYDHPQSVGAVGTTGTTAANALAAEADVVIGIGTRYSDFTTASKTAFQNPSVRFININVSEFDAYKHAAIALTGDARATLEELQCADHKISESYRTKISELKSAWEKQVEQVYAIRKSPITQAEVIRVVNDFTAPSDILVGASGSSPGDLHKLWRTREPGGYHMEYGYSTMGYEIAGGLGVKMAYPDREVYVLVGDGSYLMMSQEIVTSVQEGYKLNIILIDNYGFSSIGGLSRSCGNQGMGTEYRFRKDGKYSGEKIPVDFEANAASLGAWTIRAKSGEELKAALAGAREQTRTSVVVIEAAYEQSVPGYESWWDVPIAEVSELESVRAARREYEEARKKERYFF